MDNTNVLTYLGIEVSQDVKNLETNIKRRETNNQERKMNTNLQKPLRKKYTFECGFIFLNYLIRSSVLYGAEVMYTIAEKELR